MHIKQDNFCPSYGITFIYEVNITSLNSNRSSCADDLSCSTSFNSLTGMVEEFGVSIKAENEFGSSDLVVYPTTIGMLVILFIVDIHDNEIQPLSQLIRLSNISYLKCLSRTISYLDNVNQLDNLLELLNALCNTLLTQCIENYQLKSEHLWVHKFLY